MIYKADYLNYVKTKFYKIFKVMVTFTVNWFQYKIEITCNFSSII